MSARSEKGGGDFEGIKLLLCENPLPPIDEAIEAARAEIPRSNYYTEPFSAPLRRMIAEREEDKIRERSKTLRSWTRELAAALVRLGPKVYPSETYFFLADFSPRSAEDLAKRLEQRNILVKPLNDPVLGRGYMRVTTALPEDNQRFVAALAEVLGHGEDRSI